VVHVFREKGVVIVYRRNQKQWLEEWPRRRRHFVSVAHASADYPILLAATTAYHYTLPPDARGYLKIIPVDRAGSGVNEDVFLKTAPGPIGRSTLRSVGRGRMIFLGGRLTLVSPGIG
jgi:hypothetical protein